MEPRLNPKLQGFRCIRCTQEYPVADYFEGCPACSSREFPANLAAVYAPDTPFGTRLPLDHDVDLGEGKTPVLDLPELAASIGVAGLWVKTESRNPTGSHKDRMSPIIVARAKMLGKRHVVATSSGNAGLSLAAYAARAGLQCTVVKSAGSPGNWGPAITAFGAELITTETLSQRWRLQGELVRDRGYYPATNQLDPPVGSNPFGIQGYKTLAYELVAQMADSLPTAILVPTCRGDLLWGIWEGFREAVSAGRIDAPPRMVAVEPFARLSRILEGADYRGRFEGVSNQVSITSYDATYQALSVLQASHGTAIEAGDAEADQARARLLSSGIALERCSAAPLAAMEKLRKQGWLAKSDRVLFIGTGSGACEREVS